MKEKNCINCEHFTWWDGDYCCIEKMKILCESPKGDFNDDILKALEANKNCGEHSMQENEEILKMHKEAFKKFIDNNAPMV